jgi:hypothetical protein
MKMKPAEIALEMDLHRSTVLRQAREWGLLDADGTVDLAAYQHARATLLDAAKRPDAAGSPDLPVLAAERARKAAADASLAELQLAQKRGELLPAAEVAAAARRVFGAAMAELESGWTDVALTVARLTDPGRITDELVAAQRRAMSRLHEKFLAAAAARAAGG